MSLAVSGHEQRADWTQAVETRDIITTNRPQVQEMASESDEEELERASRKKRRDR